MSPEFHQRVRKLFDQALERPDEERLGFLADACGDEPEVYQEVYRLLGAHGAADSFLAERPTHRSERIDRYLIKSELGRGAMGVVYEAVDPLIGRTVAIKVISLEANSPKEIEFMRDGLFREARSAGVLSHPGIVTIFDVGQENDTAFITMERVEGPSLQGVLDSGGVRDIAAALDILRQAAAALDYAHESGVVHRDIKPANIMLHKGTMVKVTDFGIAKLASAHTKTLTGMVMGTPAYMSPEQIETKPLDGRSDQFSLAVMAFELLTGVKPFQGTLLGPLMHAIIYADRPSARAANPALPVGIDAVLERALRRMPEERFGSCSEFVASLDACFPSRIPAGNTLGRPQSGQFVAPPPSTRQSGIRSAITLPPPPPPTGGYPPSVPGTGGYPAVPGTGAVPPMNPIPQPPVRRGTNPLPYILAACGAVVLVGGYLAYHFLVQPHPTTTTGGVTTPPKITAPPKSIGSAPVVSRFAVEPQSVEAGTAAKLRWDVSGATEVTIDPGVGAVQPGGEVEIKPTASTSYVLTARGPGGNAVARAEVEVTAAKPPPKNLPTPPRVSAFRTDPTTIRRGERFRMDWSVEGASQVNIDHGIGKVAASGSQSVLADNTTTYTLTATGNGGTTTGQTTVTVTVPAEPAKSPTDLYDEAVAARKAQQPAKAATLFQQAANRGEARAMLELGLMYRSGEGVPQDIKQAVSWMEKSANAGNSSGMDYMGSMYVRGEGVPQDDRQAMTWYSKAAAAGNPVGMDALGQMYRNGRGVAQNYPQAMSWFGKSAAAGNPSGMYHLGQMYENGWGIARNPNTALSYYQKAAAGGDREAKKRLDELRQR